jgi:hypothetical protein
MHRVTSALLLLVCFITLSGIAARAQDDSSGASATCNFDEEKQLMVQYQHFPINLKKPLPIQVPFGKVWSPGGKAMALFTNTPIQIGSRTLPIGAYTLFVIPNSKQWTLVVSKSTDTSGAYDPQQDLVRVPLESGELPSPEGSLNVAFAHVAPQQCNIRIDLEKFGHFAEIHQRQ